MTTPRDPDGSTRITGPSSGSTGYSTPAHTPTTTGADVTGRMAGTAPTTRTDGSYTPTTSREADPARHPHLPAAAKTSAAATFGLVFGLAALFCALTAILAPAAVVLGIIGVIVAAVGLKMSRRPGVTGHKVAVGGLVTALLGVVLGGVVIGGLTAIVNDRSQLDRITNKVDQLRNDLPSGQQITNTVRP